MYNMKTTFLISMTFVVIGVTHLVAAETVIQIDLDGQTIVGTLNIPETSEPVPVVLMLPGFGSARDELMVTGTNKGVYAHMADQLAQNDVASLRIDYRGSGDSDGLWQDTSFSSQISDALAGVSWLVANAEIDGSRIAVLGWSQGGLIAAHVAGARPSVTSVSVWAPVVQPRTTFSGLLGEKTVASALAGSAELVHTATLPWGVDTALKGQFYHELVTTSPAAAIATYEGPLLVIVGSNDTIVTPQPASGQTLLNYHEGAEKLVIFETGHAWGAFEGPEMLMNNVIPTTIDWIKSGF